MNRIWIFGDSFSELHPDRPQVQWQLLLSKSLQADIFNVAHNGTSSEWLICKIIDYWNNFRESDLVIIVVPYWNRECIFVDDPDFSQLYNVSDFESSDEKIKNRWKKYSREKKDAFKNYFLHLHDENLVKAKTSSLYAWAELISMRITTPVLIIETRDQAVIRPTLKKSVVAQGNLMDVNCNEWIKIDFWYEVCKQPYFSDQRISHLSERNHLILAEKIEDYFRYQKVPDLTSGFHKNFLNKIWNEI